MARKVSPFKTGLFALICLALLAGTIVWLKASLLLQNMTIYATYFNVSVKGLQKDAVVNYRGVPVGRVESVGIAPDGRLIEILIKLQSDFRVDGTIAARLREQGLTGLRYLEIDTAPPEIDELTPKIMFPSKYPILKSYPSEIELLETYLRNLYTKLSSLDLERLTESWTKTSVLFNDILTQLGAESGNSNLKQTISALREASLHLAALTERLSKSASPERVERGVQDLTATLASARKASIQLQKQLESLPPGTLKHLSDQFDQTLNSGDQAFSSIGARINESAGLLNRDLQQLGLMISQLSALVQSIKEHPNRLIFQGKQPPEPLKGR